MEHLRLPLFFTPPGNSPLLTAFPPSPIPVVGLEWLFFLISSPGSPCCPDFCRYHIIMKSIFLVGGACNIVNCPRAIYNFANCPRTLYNIVNCPGTLYNIVNCPWVIFAQGTVYKTMSVLGVTFGDLALYFNARDTDAAATRLITTITTTTITVVFRPPASVSVVQRENAWEVHKDYDYEGAKILLQRSRGGL